MKEYIDREAVKNKFSDLLPIGRSIRDTIDEVPAADVAPVVHGEWIMFTNFDGNLNHYECSVCHQAQGYKSNYCEECGAKMDKEN